MSSIVIVAIFARHSHRQALKLGSHFISLGKTEPDKTVSEKNIVDYINSEKLGYMRIFSTWKRLSFIKSTQERLYYFDALMFEGFNKRREDSAKRVMIICGLALIVIFTSLILSYFFLSK